MNSQEFENRYELVKIYEEQIKVVTKLKDCTLHTLKNELEEHIETYRGV